MGGEWKKAEMAPRSGTTHRKNGRIYITDTGAGRETANTNSISREPTLTPGLFN